MAFGLQYIAHGCYTIVVSIYFPYFTLLVCLSWVIVVVELNCEIHIAHNLKIKLLKVKFIHLFSIKNKQTFMLSSVTTGRHPLGDKKSHTH